MMIVRNRKHWTAFIENESFSLQGLAIIAVTSRFF